MHNFFAIKFLILIYFAFDFSIHAWWDTGHMLIAGIAQSQLTDEEIFLIEYPLKFFDTEYPGLNSIITSAVWPDHLKCVENCKICQGSSTDGLEIFNNWHYVGQLYNPQNITLSNKGLLLPYPFTGCIWALSSFLGIDLKQKFKAFREIYKPNWKYIKAPLYENYPGMRPNRHSIYNEELSTLSRFSWNLRLRFLIHIFGDMHQPLHVIETFSKQFPNGDLGGNSIEVEFKKGINNLHSLWDSCGGKYNETWPEVTEEFILNEAAVLMKKYPMSMFDFNKVNTFEKVAKNSYKIALKHVYNEFNFTNQEQIVKLPYRPSENYLTELEEICQKQIVIGGYRLSFILKDIAFLFKQAKWIESKDDKLQKLNQNVEQTVKPDALKLMIALIIFLIVCLTYKILYLLIHHSNTSVIFSKHKFEKLLTV